MQTSKEKLREAVRGIARRMGFEVVRRSSAPLGFNKYTDLPKLLAGNRTPTIIDVGSNVGHTIIAYKKLFPDAVIHAFEPSPAIFEELERRITHLPGVIRNQVALGSKSEARTFLENSETHMSSFLNPDRECWGKVVKETQVQVRTLDDYCADAGVHQLDLLKVDAQGFDLEVLKGATRMIGSGQIPLLLIEITFARHYVGAPTFDELYRFLIDHGYRLMTLYELQYRNGLAHWCDALFVHESSPRCAPLV